MLYIFGITVLFCLLFILAMSIGILLGGKPIKGSCGGQQNEDGGCATCGKKNEDSCYKKDPPPKD